MAINYLRSRPLRYCNLCFLSKTRPFLLHYWNEGCAFSSTPFSKTTAYPNHDSNLAREESLLSLLKKCANIRDLDQLHAQIIRLGFHQNLFVIGKALEFCSVSDSDSNLMDYAEKLFKNVESADVFLCNTMIRGFGNARMPQKVCYYYNRMRRNEEIPDSFTFSFLLKICGQLGLIVLGKQVHCHVVKYGLETHAFVVNTLIHVYGMLSQIENARQLFDEMPIRDLVSWNCIIDCHAHAGLYREALEIYMSMLQNGTEPDEATLVVILTCCSALGALDMGKQIHSSIINTTLMKIVSVCNSLMDMYAKCGAVEEAFILFNGMKDRNIISWNTIILGLAVHGRGEAALNLFRKMLEDNIQTPDELTFLGVLCACSHVGLVEEGKRIFSSMIRDYDVQPTEKHYGCMVDLLGRAGLIEEAFSLVENVSSLRGNSVVWRSLLSACRVHGNLELGQKARRRLLELEKHSSDYVLLANIYGGSEKWNEMARERMLMKDGVANKIAPANSWITILPKTDTELDSKQICSGSALQNVLF